MISSLIDAAKALVSAATSLQKLGDERRTKIATYFDAISKVLSAIPERKLKDEPFVDLCGELHVYAEMLEKVASSAVSPVELLNLVKTLQSAEDMRGMLSLEWAEYTYRDMPVATLQEAAGLFRGLAATLRAQ